MKEFLESLKNPLWLVAAIIAAWAAWMLKEKK